MPRRAESYPCCFCSKTSETRALAQAHIAKRHTNAVLKLAGAIAFRGARLWGAPTGQNFIVTPEKITSKLEGGHKADVWVKVK